MLAFESAKICSRFQTTEILISILIQRLEFVKLCQDYVNPYFFFFLVRESAMKNVRVSKKKKKRKKLEKTSNKKRGIKKRGKR